MQGLSGYEEAHGVVKADDHLDRGDTGHARHPTDLLSGQENEPGIARFAPGNESAVNESHVHVSRVVRPVLRRVPSTSRTRSIESPYFNTSSNVTVVIRSRKHHS